MKDIEELMQAYKGLIGVSVQRMSQKQATLFTQLTLGDLNRYGTSGSIEVATCEADWQQWDEYMGDKPKPFAYAVLESRLLAAAGINNLPRPEVCTPSVMLFATTLCESPGDAVMWAFTIWRMRLAQMTPVGIADLARAFPMGFPDRPGRNAAWDAQKIDSSAVLGDNGLNVLQAWPRK